MSSRSQAELLIWASKAREQLESEISDFLLDLGKLIPKDRPPPKELVRELLKDNQKESESLRIALGLPAKGEDARLWLEALKIECPYSESVSALFNSRLQRFLERVAWVNEAYGFLDSDSKEALDRASNLAKIRTYDSQPSLEVVVHALTAGTLQSLALSTNRFVDGDIFLLLNAVHRFLNGYISNDDKERILKPAVEKIHQFITDRLNGSSPLQDASILWWGLWTYIRCGHEMWFRDPVKLVQDVASKFNSPDLFARSEYASMTPTPEIFSRFSTACWMIENGTRIYVDLYDRFGNGGQLDGLRKNIIVNLTKELSISSDGGHLYNKASSLSAIDAYLQYWDFETLREISSSGYIDLSHYSPVGRFISIDSTLNDIVLKVKASISNAMTSGNQKHWQTVLVYSIPSNSKSKLVKEFFNEFNQGNQLDNMSKFCPISEHDFYNLFLEAQKQSFPFVFLDEFDNLSDNSPRFSLYTPLLKLLEGRNPMNDVGKVRVKSGILFLAGSKYLTMGDLFSFMHAHKDEGDFQNGEDLLTRINHKIEIPSYLNKVGTQLVLVGCAELLEKYKAEKLRVSLGLLTQMQALTTRRQSRRDGIRSVQNYVANAQDFIHAGDTVVLRGEKGDWSRLIGISWSTSDPTPLKNPTM